MPSEWQSHVTCEPCCDRYPTPARTWSICPIASRTGEGATQSSPLYFFARSVVHPTLSLSAAHPAVFRCRKSRSYFMFLWQKFHANATSLLKRDDAIAKSRCMMMPSRPRASERANAIHGTDGTGAGPGRIAQMSSTLRTDGRTANDGAPSSSTSESPDNGGPIIGFLWALET